MLTVRAPQDKDQGSQKPFKNLRGSSVTERLSISGGDSPKSGIEVKGNVEEELKKQKRCDLTALRVTHLTDTLCMNMHVGTYTAALLH